MCYSAQVVGDFRKYERYGGRLDLAAYVKVFWSRGKEGDFHKVVPMAVRTAFDNPQNDQELEIHNAVLQAYRDVDLVLEQKIGKATEKLLDAKARLAKKWSKTAEKDKLSAHNAISDLQAQKAELGVHAANDGWTRIWPGHYTPVMIRDPETGQRVVAPMRYRARPLGFTLQDEKDKPGCYNARKSSLRTVWRGIFGVSHGVILASRFYESVKRNDFEHRALAPGESPRKIEIVFSPEPAQDMFLACIWRYVVPEDPTEAPFYGVAAITRDPPPEVSYAGHDRCVIPIRPENIDAWLNPDPKNLKVMMAILDDPIDAVYQAELVPKKGDQESQSSEIR